MIPLREPKLFGEDEIMQMMISSGRFGQESPAGLKQIDHVYSAHKIPLVNKKNILSAKESDEIKFCGKSCRDEAEKQLLPLLWAIQTNAAPLKKLQGLFDNGWKSCGVLVRMLARASIDPNFALTTMSTYVLKLPNSAQSLFA
jgi:hypothetical protein